MKICFLLQRRFAYLGHSMAILFKQKYGIGDFCGYASSWTSYNFLQNQKDIQYTRLLSDEEIHERYKKEALDLAYLKNFEKEYGLPNLWPYICLDRVIRYNQLVREYPYDAAKYSHEEMLRIFQVTAKAIVQFLDQEKPDCVILSVVSSIGNFLLYRIAQKRGIKTLLIDSARIGNKYFLTEFYDRSNYLEDAFLAMAKSDPADEPYRQRAREFIRQYQEKARYYLSDSGAAPLFKNQSFFKKHFKFLTPKGFFNSLHWLWREWSEFFRNSHKNDYTAIKPWNAFWDRLKRKTRILIGYGDLYDKFDWDSDFAYFPLHTEPEAYPMLLAPFFTDQLWTVKQVARSLPAHYKLYVKDHPVMSGYRTRQYYRELKKIPNVCLLDPAVDSLELIKKSKMVITIVGTASWEAALLKKPVIVLGKIFYDLLPAVKRCENIQTLPYLIKDQLENFQYDEESLVNLIAALFKESVDVDLVKLWDVEGGQVIDRKTNELEPLVDLFAQKIGLNN